jgi:Flp pilus assembly protein TadB
MDETIPLLFAVKQEISLRKSYQLILLAMGATLILVAVASYFRVTLPVTLLAAMLLIHFYVTNKKEIDRLSEKYVR